MCDLLPRRTEREAGNNCTVGLVIIHSLQQVLFNYILDPHNGGCRDYFPLGCDAVLCGLLV